MITEEIDNSENSIGEMVAEDYRKAEVFKKFGIDFCCGGKDSLDYTCKRKGIDVGEVKQALKKLDNRQTNHPSQDYNNWQLDFLCDYIMNTHHKYVNDALPQLDEYSSKVARVHGDFHPEVVEIDRHYREVANELRMHMQKEEGLLFPYIKQLVNAKRRGESIPTPPFGSVRNPIKMMEMEHESAGGALQAINELSRGYNPPDEACNTYKVFYAKLQEFEQDLHQHIHLENNLLFPKAIALEKDILG